jgi:hypothetical protein
MAGRGSGDAQALLEKQPTLDLTRGAARAQKLSRFSVVARRFGAGGLGHGLVLAVRFVRAGVAGDHGRQRTRNDDDETLAIMRRRREGTVGNLAARL